MTDAIKSYVEEKLTRALANYAHTVKEVDVTLSARGGDTGTHGKKEQKVDVTVFTLRNGVVRGPCDLVFVSGLVLGYHVMVVVARVCNMQLGE